MLIVVFKDNPDMTLECVSSLSAESKRVLIDAGSTTASRERVMGNAKGCVLLEYRALGLVDGWNKGMEEFLASTDNYAVFAHNDTRARGSDWLTKMRLAYDAYVKCGVVVPGNMTGGFQEVRPRHVGLFMVHRDVATKVGRFNPEFSLRPDVEYFKRVAAAGYKIVACDAQIEHRGGGTTFKTLSKTQYAAQIDREIAALKGK